MSYCHKLHTKLWCLYNNYNSNKYKNLNNNFKMANVYLYLLWPDILLSAISFKWR